MAAPIILSDNRFLDALPGATGVADGSALNVRDCRTYTFLKFPAPGTNYLTVNCGSAAPADCLALIGHNLASASALVSVETSRDGVTWAPVVYPFQPSSDKALLKTFLQAVAPHWRLKIVTAEVAPYLAVAMVGSRLEFPAPPAGGPPKKVSVVEDSKDSITGNPLGTIVHYSPVEASPSFQYLSRNWVETVYRPWWMSYARLRKWFFWAWDIDTYPDDVLFVKEVGNYEPSVSVLAYYDTLRLSLKGVMEP